MHGSRSSGFCPSQIGFRGVSLAGHARSRGVIDRYGGDGAAAAFLFAYDAAPGLIFWREAGLMLSAWRAWRRVWVVSDVRFDCRQLFC